MNDSPQPELVVELVQMAVDYQNAQLRQAQVAKAANDRDAYITHMAAALAMQAWLNKALALSQAARDNDGPDVIDYVREMSRLDPSGRWCFGGENGPSAP